MVEKKQPIDRDSIKWMETDNYMVSQEFFPKGN